MIDDADDKVRRNLVVFSAVVIGLGFLGVPVGSVAEKLIGKGAPIPANRLIAVALAVLIYLLARYRFLKETEELMARVLLHRIKLTQVLIVWLANFRANVWSRGGPDIRLFHPPLAAAVQDASDKRDRFPAERPAQVVFSMIKDAGPDDRRAHTSIAMSWRNGQAFSGGGGTVFEVKNLSIHLYRSLAWFRATMYTQAGITYAVPLLLAGGALLTLWTILIGQYGAAWHGSPQVAQ